MEDGSSLESDGASLTNKVTVLIENDDESKNTFMGRPVDGKIFNLREERSKILGVPVSALQILTSSGTPLRDEKTLLDIVGDYPNLIRLKEKLIVEEEISIGLYRYAEDVEKIQTNLHIYPSMLHESIVKLFGDLPEDSYRLVHNMDPLEEDFSLHQQGVTAGSLLLIDRVVNMKIEDGWDGSKEECKLYYSDVADLIMPPKFNTQQRLLHNGRTIEICNEVYDVLAMVRMDNICSSPPLVSFTVEAMGTIAMILDNTMAYFYGWPSKRLDQILPHSEDIYYEHSKLKTKAMLKDVFIPEDGFLHTRPRQTIVRQSNGRRKIVRVPRKGTVADIRRQLPSNSSLMLTNGSQPLDDNYKVENIAEDACIEVVERPSLEVTVKLWWKNYKLKTSHDEVKFTDLVYFLAGETGKAINKLRCKIFACLGCRRHISLGRQNFQRIPAQCCEVRSMRLVALNNNRRRSVGTQGYCALRKTRGSSAKCSTGSPTSAANARTKNRRTQACVFMADAGVMTGSSKSCLSVQHPPHIIESDQPIFFVNGTKDYMGGKSFKCVLKLPPPPCVRMLRESLAEKMDRPVERVKVMRWIGTSAAQVPIVRICDDKDMQSWDFGDMCGQVYRGGDVIEKHSRCLDDDDESLIFVPQKRSIFTVYDGE